MDSFSFFNIVSMVCAGADGVIPIYRSMKNTTLIHLDRCFIAFFVAEFFLFFILFHRLQI